VWLALQVGALALSAGRVPLSARYPVPEELLAMHVMMCVQMIAGAVLFPALFGWGREAGTCGAPGTRPFGGLGRSLGVAVLIIVAAPVMMELAGVLGARGEISVVECLYPMGWLIGLAGWGFALRGRRGQLYGVAVATMWAVGGAVLAYLWREFGDPTQPFDWNVSVMSGPLMWGLAILEGAKQAGTIWAGVGIHLVVAAVAVFWRVRRDDFNRSKSTLR